ncbi:trichohyalin-like [Actinia tenebrosa]|uniref:Trichohyalin-like n=1 Tax=Actinia tenebrosa TaxID=6105 RepID=A0A6P8H9Q3_ACTTE|nr:trichohyalin-like [Actinia tenebrosa]
MASSKEVICRSRFPDHTSLTRNKIANKKSNKKSKSKGHLVQRSAGIPPFSAWVEPVENHEPLNAVKNAVSEEIKLKKVLNEKEQHLKEFQLQVASRVKMLERMKRQEQMGKSFEAVEIVRNIVHQSSFPKAVSSQKYSSLSKQDTCSYRDNSEKTIMRPIKPGILAHSHEAVDKASQLLEEHAEDIRSTARYARVVLRSRALKQDNNLLNELPGGQWKGSLKQEQVEEFPENLTEKGQASSDAIFIPQVQVGNVTTTCNDAKDYWLGDNEIKDFPNPQENDDNEGNNAEVLPQWLAEEDQNKLTIFDSNMMNKKHDKKVTFADERERNYGNKRNDIQERMHVKANDPNTMRRQAIEDLLKPGKVAEDSKRRQRSQMALYRKLFMDIERERVRENIRMKEHRKRMAEIKVEKEIERLEVEHRHKQMLAQAEQKSLDEKLEIQRREEEEKAEYLKSVQQRNARLQKSKESERFVDAMKAVIKEKIRSKGISVPPLCACGPSIWDTHPDTCANNCIYYKNPKEYAKAMSSLLNSLES